MIGRADIEGSKRNIIKNTQLQQASYPCGNFFNTTKKKKILNGSKTYAFAYIQIQATFWIFSKHQISVLIELTLK